MDPTTAKISPSERESRWRTLIDRHVNYQHKYKTDSKITTPTAAADPFSCNDLITPSIKTIVSQTLAEGVSQWRELDSRRVPPSSSHNNTSSSHDDPEQQPDESENNKRQKIDATSSSSGSKKLWGWHRLNRIRLPPNFDYETRLPRPPTPPPISTPCSNDKVVSLVNPGTYDDYESELWNIFSRVPTKSELDLPRHFKCRQVATLRDEIDEAYDQYTRVDCFALGRTRAKDRHHYYTHDTNVAAEDDVGYGAVDTLDDDGVVVRVEVWKKTLKRGSSPEYNRLEMDFWCGSAPERRVTLWDLHRVIAAEYRGTTTTMGMYSHEDWDAAADEATREVVPDGMFFIEGKFYESRKGLDYHVPIVTWLNEDGLSGTRRDYLNLSSTIKTSVDLMSETLLHKLQFRLNHRYYYCFHGNKECSLFFTDVRMKFRHELLPSPRMYPLIVDAFTSATSNCVCEGCGHCSAVVVCLDDELTDGDATYLCSSCYYSLHYDSRGNLRYDNFEVYSLEDIDLVE